MTATLLAIDDSKTMRKVLEITFAGENYRTVLSESASDALVKLRSEHPAIVLLDAILGGSSGYEVCQRIKAEAPGVGVIMLSSKQHPYDRARGTAAGADDFIDKPYDTQALIDKVAALIQRLGEGAARHAAQPVARPVAAPPAAAPAQRQQTTMSFGSAAPAPRPAAAAPARVSIPTSAAASAAAAVPTAAAPVPATAALVGATNLESKLQGLGLTREQVAGVLAISKDVVEQVVWEVVPVLAEALIREEIQRLTAE